MDYIDEAFMNSDAPQEHKELYLKCLAIAKPFIDEWSKDPLADHRALYDEMKAKMMDFLKEHNPNCDFPTVVSREDDEFLHSGIEDKALHLEFKAIVQPYIDKANADPWSDHSRLRRDASCDDALPQKA